MKLSAILPEGIEQQNEIRVGYTTEDVSTQIVAGILLWIIENELGMSVVPVNITSDLEAKHLLEGDQIDVYIGMEYVRGQQTMSHDEFSHLFNFNLGYTAQLELYLYIPPSLDIGSYDINHYLYANELQKWLPPPGTYTTDSSSCMLWWCREQSGRGGQFVPTHCKNENGTLSACGQLLVSTGLRSFPSWSMLAEIVQNLKLPFVVTFVNQSTIDRALRNDKHIILYLSDKNAPTIDESLKFQLPPFHKDCILSSKTSYLYTNRRLGGYNCDFPIADVYIMAGSRIEKKISALLTLLKSYSIEKEELFKMVRQAAKLPKDVVVARWVKQNVQKWKTWIEGCERVEGHFGIRGKCNPCPPDIFYKVIKYL